MINALPSSLRALIDRIELAIKRWPIQITIDRAIRWVLQFEAEDYLLAVRILENLDVLGPTDIRAALEVAHTKLLRKMAEKGSPMKGNNTLYAGIGSAAKSGALISYHYRTVAGLPEDDFISTDEEQELDIRNIENIVFVDDFIGTGKMISKEIKRIAEEVYALSGTRKIFILAVAGYEEGIQHIVEETGASVVCALEYSSRDTVALLDATFYEGLPVAERSAALDRIKRYCRVISTSELGFGAIGGLLVFDHNTPNTTLPLVWHNGKGWNPLFPRSGKIPGAAKVLKSAQDERSQHLAKEQQIIPREKAELTLFVEGKIDELFIDNLRQRHKLAQCIGVGEVTAIALGGLYQSNRLLELVRSAKKHAVFVLDDDQHAKRASHRTKALTDVPVLFLKPYFVAMLDLEKMYTQRDRFTGFPDPTVSLTDPRWLHEVELAVLKRGPILANSERILQLIDEYLDPAKYEEFVSCLRKIVDEMFEKESKPSNPSAPAKQSKQSKS